MMLPVKAGIFKAVVQNIPARKTVSFQAEHYACRTSPRERKRSCLLGEDKPANRLGQPSGLV